MPKRLVDGDSAWESDKLARCYEGFVPHYFMLLPLAEANGSFELNLEDVTRRVYGKIMPHVTADQVLMILKEFEREKLLFTWQTADGRRWGFWTGIQDRLPGRSDVIRHAYSLGAPVPVADLAKFLGRPEREVAAEIAGTAAGLSLVEVKAARQARSVAGGRARQRKGSADICQPGVGFGSGEVGGSGGGGVSVLNLSPSAPLRSPTAHAAGAEGEAQSTPHAPKNGAKGASRIHRGSGFLCDYLRFEDVFLQLAHYRPPRTRRLRELYLEAVKAFGSEEAALDAMRSVGASAVRAMGADAPERLLRLVLEG